MSIQYTAQPHFFPSVCIQGSERQQSALFSYLSLEERIPADHPLRVKRALVDPVLTEPSARFDSIYVAGGRPSIPPEQLLRALLLQVLFTVRSERQLMEQLEYNLLFGWIVALGIDDAIWVPTVFTRNRDRLLEGSIAEAFFAGWNGRPRHGSCPRMSTSRWTRPCWRRGQAGRVCNRSPRPSTGRR